MNDSQYQPAPRSEYPPVRKKDRFVGSHIGMFWLLWGNIILLSMAVKIARQQASFSYYDITYWITVALLALTRYCDIQFFNGITIRGTQATMKHWRRYLVYLLCISAVVWILVNGLSALKK